MMSLSEILTPSLLSYVTSITFPWPLTEELEGSDVGDVFFRHDSRADWSRTEIKTALVELSRLGLDNLHIRTIVGVVREQAGSSRLVFLEKITAVVLLLDQGPRNLLKDVNARYTYGYFDAISRRLTEYLLSLDPDESPLGWQAWTSAGMGLQHAALRVLMLLAPLAHSDAPSDNDYLLKLTETLRHGYEAYTRTADPHRETYAVDVRDLHLMNRLLRRGPPQGREVAMMDFVYWMMRYFTAHASYMRLFLRSPFQNVPVGRDDRDEEIPFLQEYGMTRTPKDEAVRQHVRRDMLEGRWSPLIF
jgi:uncharacterized protein (DUF924 family)